MSAACVGLRMVNLKTYAFNPIGNQVSLKRANVQQDDLRTYRNILWSEAFQRRHR